MRKEEGWSGLRTLIFKTSTASAMRPVAWSHTCGDEGRVYAAAAQQQAVWRSSVRPLLSRQDDPAGAQPKERNMNQESERALAS